MSEEVSGEIDGREDGNAKEWNFEGRVHQEVGEESQRKNFGEGSLLTDGN